MKKISTVAAACFALAAFDAAAGPFDQFKGKVKPGMYEMKMEMDMSGMGLPANMSKQTHTMQHCVTEKDIDGGGFAKGRTDKGADNCQIKDMNVSGNTATYKMVCSEPKMTADNKITFRGDGYVMDMKMAMDQGGRVMSTSQHVESRYIGPCK